MNLLRSALFSISLCLSSASICAQVSPPEFINFGYVQNNAVLPYIQYSALTHIAPPFVNFDTNGNLISPSNFTTGRNADLKANGAAQRAGTKVIACVRNNGFSDSILASVMQDPAKRTALVNGVRNLVLNDPYCQGVNFDFETSWDTTTRDGITLFLQAIRAAIPPPYEVSVYTHPTFRASYWDVSGIVNSIDYMLYSTYDFGTSRAHANADFDAALKQIAGYLDAGLPPEKMVLTWVSYGRRWFNTETSGYDVTGFKQSQGFFDTMYDTTLRQANGGPFTPTYLRGDEISYHTYQQGEMKFTAVGETPESLEYKITSALNFPGYNGAYKGVRFRGVGWWSLMWAGKYFRDFQYSTDPNISPPASDFSSYDPITGSVVPRSPYYRHIDLLVQEILKKPGQTQFDLESFENANPHWRDPNESPDTSGDTDKDSKFEWLTAPNASGRPAGTTIAGRLYFDFESTSGNKVFLRHEMLNNRTETNVVDTNAALALVSRNTRVRGHYYVSGNYSARKLRLALVDGLRQVEVSDPVTLPANPGWNTFQWDINDPSQINAWTTSEPSLLSGNGVVDNKVSGTPESRDISFLGFIVEGGGAGSGTIYFDSLTYEAVAPPSSNTKPYVINEFRYSNSASEFVEISGPPGPFPAGMQLLSYKASDGSVYKSTSLASQSIPASGYFIVGDVGVSGASGNTGFTPVNWGAGTADLPNTTPGSLQLYNAITGYAYDSAVYGAFGGVGDLSRIQTRRVTGEGYGWMGNVGPGLSGDGQPYTMGRMPDGADTNVNQRDFSFMPPTPGQPNGASGIIDTLLDFSTTPLSAFQTYQNLKFVTPASGGIPPSPGGGIVYRCVDTSGGGVVGVFGDAQMGAEDGLQVTGQLYIPAMDHPAQAVAVGFCGTQGSSFFADTPDSTGYDNGYWLVYENGVINLADGQPSHPQQFQLIAASNDNQDSLISIGTGTKSLAEVSAVANSWVNFRMQVDPAAVAGQQIIMQINDVDVYRGSIPAGAPVTGAVMVGHREAGGGVQAMEGTWVDNLLISRATRPASVADFGLYE